MVNVSQKKKKYRLAFAYSNLLKLDQPSIIYFKQTIVINTVNLKDTRLPCSNVFRLSSAGKDDDLSVVTLSSICIRP